MEFNMLLFFPLRRLIPEKYKNTNKLSQTNLYELK